jgi:hypothetical protein
VDDRGIYREAAQGNVVMRYSVMVYKDENFWSSNIGNWKKTTRSEHLVMHFSCLFRDPGQKCVRTPLLKRIKSIPVHIS